MSSQFSLFPEKTGEQLSSLRSDDESFDERDPSQIEAAIKALMGDEHTRDTDFGTPGDRKSMNGLKMNGVSPEETKRRTQYFEDQFKFKDNSFGTARERIEKDSPVIAELRTNVIVSHGKSFLSFDGANIVLRSKMSLPSSLICHTTSRHDSPAPSRRS